jgi:DNA damage-binding protein 1
VPIYGRISALKLFKPSTKSKSMLFLLTERYKFCVLEYSAEGKLLTVANGVVEDAIGRPAECGHICVVDEDATMIGLHMYDGHLKIIPIDDQGGLSEQAFNVRLDELKLVDMAFIGKGVLGVLHEDTKGSRHVRSYKIGKGGVLEDGGMRVANVDGGMIVPGPAGDGGFGCLVVGKQVRIILLFLFSELRIGVYGSKESSRKRGAKRGQLFVVSFPPGAHLPALAVLQLSLSFYQFR